MYKSRSTVRTKKCFHLHDLFVGASYRLDKNAKATQIYIKILFCILSSFCVSTYFYAGTTTAECKSGYGLDTVNEVKMLKVLEAVRSRTNVEISSTFCGAHSIPP